MGPMLWENNDIEAFADFLTYDDPVDDCKPMHGSLLPLWDVDVMNANAVGFTGYSVGYTIGDGGLYERVGETERLMGVTLDVTSICWHATDPHIFAVGLGCLEGTGGVGCGKVGGGGGVGGVGGVGGSNGSGSGGGSGGVICVYSVLDLHKPRARIDVDVGVTSVAFGADGRLAGGLRDGGVVVICFEDGMFCRPRIVRSCIDHNHLFPVWSIRWCVGREVGLNGVSGGEREDTRNRIVTTSHDGLEGHWDVEGLLDTSLQLGRQASVMSRVASAIINQEGTDHTYDPSVFLPASLTASGPFELKMVCCYGGGDGVVAHGTLEGDVGINGRWYRHHTAPVYVTQSNPYDRRYVMAASLDGSLSFWRVHRNTEDVVGCHTGGGGGGDGGQVANGKGAEDAENTEDVENTQVTDETTRTDGAGDGPETAALVLDVDVGEPIADAQWSNRSSTICAAATETGNVYIFDLSVSKEVPICCQHVSNTPLTCIRFAPMGRPPSMTIPQSSTTGTASHAEEPQIQSNASSRNSDLPYPSHQSEPRGSTTDQATEATSVSNLLVVGTSDGKMLWLKLSPNLRIAKHVTEQEGNEDFWGGQEGGIGRLGKERGVVDPRVQADILSNVLGSQPML